MKAYELKKFPVLMFIIFLVVFLMDPLIYFSLLIFGYREIMSVLPLVAGSSSVVVLLIITGFLIYNRRLGRFLETIVNTLTGEVDETAQSFINRYSRNIGIYLFIVNVIGPVQIIVIAAWKDVFPSYSIPVFFLAIGLFLAAICGMLFYYFSKQLLFPLHRRFEFASLSLFNRFFIPVVSSLLLVLSLVSVQVFRGSLDACIRSERLLLENTISSVRRLMENTLRVSVVELYAHAGSDVVRSMNMSRISYYLKALHEKRLGQTELYFVASRDGSMVSSQGRTANLSDRSYFREVMRSNAVVFSEPLVSKTTGRNIIVCAVPVIRDGKTIGLIGASIGISLISSETTGNWKNDSLSFLIVSKEGRVLYNSAGNSEDTGKGENLSETMGRNGDGLVPCGTAAAVPVEKETRLYKTVFDGKRKIACRYELPITGFSLIGMVNESSFVSSIDRGLINITVGLFIIILVVMLVVRLLTVRLSRPISNTVGLFREIADGDLTVTANDYVPDEFGRLLYYFNEVIEKLHEILHIALESSRQLSAASESLAGTSQELSGSAQNQASTIEELSASLEEVSLSFSRIANNAGAQSDSAVKTHRAMKELKEISENISLISRKALDLSGKTSGEARRGSGLMRETLEGMKSIRDSTGEISEMVDIIEDISEQVNLLSLNASIEASRAGDYGRGFAVVASEISKLAEETARRTKQVQDLVRKGAHDVARGVESVKNTSSALDDIIAYVRETDGMVTQIVEQARVQEDFCAMVFDDTRLVKEMSESIFHATEAQKDINTGMIAAIDHIGIMTQGVAAGSEEVASSAEEISSRIEGLYRHINFFKLRRYDA